VRERKGVREREVQTQSLDEMGRVVTLKKRIKYVDPSLPTLVKIPPHPIPRTWAHLIRPYEPPVMAPCEKATFIETDDIFSVDLEALGGEFEGIYMDPPWVIPGARDRA
jgi:hypothetical protein